MSTTLDDTSLVDDPITFKSSFLTYPEYQALHNTPIKIIQKAEEALDKKEKELEKGKSRD